MPRYISTFPPSPLTTSIFLSAHIDASPYAITYTNAVVACVKFRRLNYALKYFRCSFGDFFYWERKTAVAMWCCPCLLGRERGARAWSVDSMRNTQCTHHIPKSHFRWETWDSLKFLMARKHIRQRRRNNSEHTRMNEKKKWKKNRI